MRIWTGRAGSGKTTAALAFAAYARSYPMQDNYRVA